MEQIAGFIAISHQRSAVSSQPSVVSDQRSVVSGQRSAVSSQQSVKSREDWNSLLQLFIPLAQSRYEVLPDGMLVQMPYQCPLIDTFLR